MQHGQPSLLIHGVHESLGHESHLILEMAEKNEAVVLFGTSGCGKTRCLYELLARHFGLYLVARTDGNGGSGDLQNIIIDKGLESLERENIVDPQQRARFIGNLTRIVLWARLRILRFCLEQNPRFSPYAWLLLQMRAVPSLDVDIFRVLSEVVCHLWTLNGKMIEPRDELIGILKGLDPMVGMRTFLTVLDEAQLLFRSGKRMFPSDMVFSEEGETPRSIFSPVFKTLMNFYFGKHCVLTSGTGLGLLAEEDAIVSGISKRVTESSKFVKFRGWESAEDVGDYLSKFMHISVEDCESLYKTFRGRYRPLVRCVELVLQGKTIQEAREFQKKFLTESKKKGSFYGVIRQISNSVQRYKVGRVNVMATMTSILFHHLYSGLSWPVRNDVEGTIIEYGIGRLVHQDSSVHQEIDGKQSGTFSFRMNTNSNAYIDEPLAIIALRNFCMEEGLVEAKWHDLLRLVNPESSKGFVWEKYVTRDFENMFDGSKPIMDHPVFHGVQTKHPLFLQSATLVRPDVSDTDVIPHVKYGTKNYSLADYVKADPRTGSSFFICDTLAGPDLCFRVRLANGTILFAFVQTKLSHAVASQDKAADTTNPLNFYRITKDGIKRFIKERKADREDILEACKKGVLRFLVMYPAESKILPEQIDEDATLGPQLLGIVGAQNAGDFFATEHIEFLNNLKEVARDSAPP